MAKVRTADDIRSKINELEIRIVSKEQDIIKDKKEWKCMNHDKINEEIRVLMAQKLALNWAIGNTNYL